MGDNLIFVIDLDGTLKTDANAVPPFECPSISIKSGDKSYTFAKRPHIDDFLRAASTKGQLYLGTAGGKGYATKVLKAMNIDGYFDKIITAEDFARGISFIKNCIFIDNDSEMGNLKMAKMAKTSTKCIRQDLWTIDTFLGNNSDKTMLELVEEIEKLN
jgi:hypothetical protein